MRTRVSEMFDLDVPIFAFSHCRDVVAAVSRAGGMGVFGASGLPPEQLSEELRWLDEHVQGKPYGIDLVVPTTDAQSLDELKAHLPQRHVEFVNELGRQFRVPPPSGAIGGRNFGRGVWGPKLAAEQWSVAREHGIRLVVSALGPLPPAIAEQARDADIRIGGMCGTPEHARRHVEGGADLVIAQGTEAGGHTGEISTFVLTPQVVDAVAPVPVLAAGGVGTGRHVVAALALGAQGVWTGSIWLASNESSVHPTAVEKILAASSRDAVRSRARTGKPLRQLRTPWVAAWDDPDAPDPLPAPWQRALVYEQMQSIEEHGIAEPIGSAAGQIVGMINRRRPAAQILESIIAEYVDVSTRLRERFTDESHR
jgi:NAD(P)H-dependent flavin oxidoreductase YrpB (nitropropane dioxygenase family)